MGRIIIVYMIKQIKSSVLNHCYQRAENGMLLFYCVSDYLVYFTHYCILARRYNIKVLSLCFMPDHIHDSIIVEVPGNLSRFKQKVNSDFTRAHNQVCHLSGRLFEKSYGIAPKIGGKAERTNLIYVGNNGVERNLSSSAEEYRWNFLAYAVSPNPFSDKLVIRESRWPMRRAVKEVKACFKSLKPLTYSQLQRLFNPLTDMEKAQLVDYIINLYNVIDYKAAISRFDSYEKMLTAMHSTTGSEHDIKEEFTGYSDACYAKIARYVLQLPGVKDVHDVLAWDDERKWGLYQDLRGRFNATSKQIAKFLRMAVKWK